MLQVTVADTTLSIEDERIDGDIEERLEQYMSGERVVFDEAVGLSDLTLFQQQVLSAIRTVPYSETVTYGELAEQIGRPAAVRAVANACGVNPVPVVIPCHRIVAQDGLGGYAEGTAAKKALIALEQDS